MVKLEYPVIDLTADDHDGEPAAQRRRVQVEPDHLLCPITREMFRDPVMVMESGHTYERKAIERHLQNDRTDPLTRARIDTAPVTNMNTRNAVQAWLDENPGITPDGWSSREMLPPQRVATNLSSLSPPAEADLPERIRVLVQMRREIRRLEMIRELRRSEADSSEMIMPLREPRHTRTVRPDRRTQRPTMSPTSNFTISSSTPRRRGRSAAPTRSPDPSMECHRPDLEVLREWRESCPELRDLWRGDDVGRWYGVTWSSDGRVTELHLDGMRLSGQLPRLDGLTLLREVDLTNNRLSGPILEKLFEGLTALWYVNLSGNQLSGPIPEKLFEGLTSLRMVNLARNRLSGPIPEKLFEGLTSLQRVSLPTNQLSGAIPEKLFEGLTSLQDVDLCSNQLSGPIPEKLFEGLTSLQEVRLLGNLLSGPIPAKLFEGLTSLQRVAFSTNLLSGPIPEKLFEGLTSLRWVRLTRNRLSGPIPAKLFEGLTSLQYVDFGNNQLSGPIPEKLFEGLTSLQTVGLRGNQLVGPIPETLFEGLTSLKHVYTLSNQLMGSIPERLRAVVML